MKRIAKIVVAVLIPVGVVGGYLATGFYILPAWLQHNLPALIKKETGLDANLSKATFNPLTFQLELTQFEIPKMARFETLVIQILWRESLVTKSLVIENITLDKPVFELEKQKNGALNIDALLPKSDTPPSENNAVFPVTIKNFVLTQGQFTFQNDKINEQITPINFTLTHFSTTDSTPAKFDLNASFKNGGTLNLSGDFQFSKLTSTGKITFQHLDLAHLLSLIPENKIKLTGDGELSANYHVAFNEKTPLIQIENSAISLTNLSYQNKITLQKIALENLAFDSVKQLVQLESLALNTFRFTEGQAQFDLPNLTFNELSFNLQTQAFQTANISLKDAELLDTTQNTLLFKLPSIDLKTLAFDLKKKTLAIGAIQAKNADFKAWLNPNGELN